MGSSSLERDIYFLFSAWLPQFSLGFQSSDLIDISLKGQRLLIGGTANGWCMMLSYGFAIVSKENIENAAPMPPSNNHHQQQISWKQTTHTGEQTSKT